MWIVLGSLLSTSLIALSYLSRNSPAIVIERKKSKIIILSKTLPTVLNFSDLVSVDLTVDDTRPIIGKVKPSQEFFKNAQSIHLKITAENTDSPISLYFINKETKKAVVLHNKLSEIITLSQSKKAASVKTSAEFQLKNLNEFRTNLLRQSAG
jgi:hypothetical protein